MPIGEGSGMRSKLATHGVVGLFLVLGGWCCSSHKTVSETVGQPQPPSEARAETGESEEVLDLIREAQRELALGEKLLAQNNSEEARLAFNRAVDVLLSVDGGADRHPEIKPVYAQLVERIHALEMQGEDTEPEEAAGQALWEEELESVINVSEAEDSSEISTPDSVTYDIPIDHNAKVAAIVEMFQTRRRDWFQSALRRSGQYIEFAREVFRVEGLPEDLVYLGMVESAFKTRAVSRAGARGMWQFMGGTGRLYGLRQDYWTDDRFDPEKSTRAAAEHLKDLYEDFGDWYLVMAAYNAGPNRVKRAIAGTGTRDFWEISRTRYLRRETKSYVPLILATIIIAKDPSRYGFELEADPPVKYDSVLVDAPVDLGTAAKCADTTLDEMKKLNPELRRWVTPLNRGEYVLKIPEGSADRFCRAMEAVPPEERVRFLAYTVRRGDTLSQIARKYGTTVSALQDSNRIGRRSLIKPGQVLTVPVPAGTSPQPSQASSRKKNAPTSGGDVYVVRAGDTLSEIADTHGVALSSLRDWNGLGRRSLIRPGDELVVYGVDSGDGGGKNGSSGTGRVVYRIQRGDTLSRIARRFDVSVSDIRRWNQLPHNRIVAGESLEIYPPSP